MDKRNRIFIIILFLFLLVSATAKYYKFFILQDYTLLIETSCNPDSESCFSYECTYPSDEDCEPYKYIEINANDFIQNELEDEEYGIQCNELEVSCDVIECLQEETVEGEECIM